MVDLYPSIWSLTNSHNHTASLLELAQGPGKKRPGNFLDLVLDLVSMLLLVLLVVRSIPSRQEGRVNATASKVHIDATGILLRRILESQLTTHFLDTRFNLLDVVRRMIPFADDPTSTIGIST